MTHRDSAAASRLTRAETWAGELQQRPDREVIDLVTEATARVDDAWTIADDLADLLETNPPGRADRQGTAR